MHRFGRHAHALRHSKPTTNQQHRSNFAVVAGLVRIGRWPPLQGSLQLSQGQLWERRELSFELANALSTSFSKVCSAEGPPLRSTRACGAPKAASLAGDYTHCIPRKTHSPGLLAYCACSALGLSRKPYLHWLVPFLRFPQISGTDAVHPVSLEALPRPHHTSRN
jgi:hypothetical protein